MQKIQYLQEDLTSAAVHREPYLAQFCRFLEKDIDKESCHYYNSLTMNDKKSCQKDKKLVKGGKYVPLVNHLKEYRAKIDVNQQEMGKLVGVSRQTISQIERGDYSPSVTLALKIARVFDAKVEDIFDYVEDEE